MEPLLFLVFMSGCAIAAIGVALTNHNDKDVNITGLVVVILGMAVFLSVISIKSDDKDLEYHRDRITEITNDKNDVINLLNKQIKGDK